MGVKDTITKDYMEDPYIFADVFNYWIYAGQEVIKPEKLHSLDTTEIAIPYGSKWAGTPVQKYRDKLKYLSAMTDHSAVYLLLGLEIQSEIHYAMPVKAMVYDALQYASQVDETAKAHRKERKSKKNVSEDYMDAPHMISSGEYLSGFYKNDRLIPVITLILYFGADKWDGPVHLHEMMAVQDEQILCWIPDYRINLITPEGLEVEEFDQFHTSLREVLLFIKYSKDKEKLYDLVSHDSRFSSIEQKAGRVINAITGAGIKMDESEETIDMCKAIEDLQEEAMQTGRQNRENEIIIHIYEKGAFTAEEIADMVNVSAERVRNLVKKYKKL
ncbi:MAG: transposase [Oliverpabstia sp.]